MVCSPVISTATVPAAATTSDGPRNAGQHPPQERLAGGIEGGWTAHVPSGEKMFIYDASVKYAAEGTPLIILAGKEYGTGSSRDWAAKGVLLLGVRRHRRKLRTHPPLEPGRMGVLPLQFLPGENAKHSVSRASKAMPSRAWRKQRLVPSASRHGHGRRWRGEDVPGSVRIDTPQEVEYFRNGGILPFVLRQVAA